MEMQQVAVQKILSAKLIWNGKKIRVSGQIEGNESLPNNKEE